MSRLRIPNCVPVLEIASSGPVTTPAAKARIEGYITSAEKEGGKILLDGRGKQVPNYPDGNFVGATLIEATADLTAYKYVSPQYLRVTAT